MYRVNRGYLGLGLFESTFIILYLISSVLHYNNRNQGFSIGRNRGSISKPNRPIIFQFTADFAPIKRDVSFFAKNCDVETFWATLVKYHLFFMWVCNPVFVCPEGMLQQQGNFPKVGFLVSFFDSQVAKDLWLDPKRLSFWGYLGHCAIRTQNAEK